MRKIHTHNGHGHCDHCTHYCEPCSEVYCCKCGDSWSKWGRTYIADWTYRPWTGPYYTVTAGSTTSDYKIGLTGNVDIEKVTFHTSGDHKHN